MCGCAGVTDSVKLPFFFSVCVVASTAAVAVNWSGDVLLGELRCKLAAEADTEC